jgi:beta-aspartyl-peptidase (threonine type)
MSNPRIIVHGGAGSIQAALWPTYRDGARHAALLGQAVLDSGGSALDAVIAATINMEDNPVFNCGTGSALTLDGSVECDAFLMTDNLEIGAVSLVRELRNPIKLARIVLEHSLHNVIAGQATSRLASEHGMELIDNSELVVDRRRRRWQQMLDRNIAFMADPEAEATDDPVEVGDQNGCDTVGACAVDAKGGIAVAGSTGGIMLKYPGRVGDTPMVGSGSYAGPAGAVTCTGHGEAIMRVCLAKYCYDLMAAGKRVDEACRGSIAHLVDSVDGFAGLIAIAPDGSRAWATSTPNLPVGIAAHCEDGCFGFAQA